MNDRLLPFDLERRLRALEPRAELSIGGSGCPRADLAPFLDGLADLWRLGTDEATAAAAEAVALAYGVPADEVLFTAGASEADLVCALALAGPGARVVVERPAYHALLAPATALGCEIVRVGRRAEDGFALDVGAVARAMREGETKLALLASPHNPTGAWLSPAELRELGDEAERAGAYVVVDEVFADATDAGDRPARRAHPRVISVNSLTKCLGFSGLRVGWAIAPREAMEALDRAKALASCQVALLSLALTPRILARRDRLIAPLRARRRENARVVEAFAKDRELAWSAPQHGTTCALRVGDDLALATRLLDAEGTVVTPGSWIELPGWIRVGLAGETAALREGLARLGRHLG